MKVSDFDFALPDELIARQPLPCRSESRLLTLNKDTGDVAHRSFVDMVGILQSGDLLVFNDTKVFPARLYGKKETGGKIELLIERIIDQHTALAHLRSSKSPNSGTRLLLEGGLEALVKGRQGDLFELLFTGDEALLEMLERHGHVPLPPYIERDDTREDRDRYQTVYAAKPGAVAAPTAGLHFDEQILQALKDNGVEFAYVTLHVGAGTFQPVRVDDVADHTMHSEYIEVEQAVVDQISRVKNNSGKVVAVGTTSARSLESAAMGGVLRAFHGESNIFIYPGYSFHVVDALLTNFHLPRSTLIMLVSALAGKDCVLKAYSAAIKEKYRFYSYGDAMFIS